jgi:hypothetical protein
VTAIFLNQATDVPSASEPRIFLEEKVQIMSPMLVLRCGRLQKGEDVFWRSPSVRCNEPGDMSKPTKNVIMLKIKCIIHVENHGFQWTRQSV